MAHRLWVPVIFSAFVLLQACASPGAAPAAPTATQVPAPSGAAAPSAPSAAAAPAVVPRELRAVRLGMTAYGASYMDHLVAIEKGYYREEGLDIEVFIAGGGVITPAIIAGEVQFSTSAGSALSAMVRGADLKVVYTNLDRPVYQLWSSTPEIRTLQDLVGKRVGISSRGDTHELSMRLLLRKHGIDPNSVVYAALGSGATRISAIEAGAVDAATLAPRDFVQLSRPRGNMLADVEREIQLVYTGVVTSGPFLQTEREVVERFLRGAVKGREYARRHRDGAIDIIEKFQPLGRELTAEDYDTVVRTYTEEGWVSDEVLRAEIATRAELVDADTLPQPQDLFDYALVKKIYADLRASRWEPAP